MKIRALPVFLSLILTLGLLFGGWFMYQQFYVQRPIEEFIVSKQQVVLKEMDIHKVPVTVELDFKDPNTFAMDFKEIKQFIASKTNKPVEIRIPPAGEEMKKLWEEEYFFIAEAIKKQEYSEIPKIIEKVEKERQLEKSVTRMDQENIYVYLQKGSDHLYAVLPLTEEVKPGE